MMLIALDARKINTNYGVSAIPDYAKPGDSFVRHNNLQLLK